MKQHNAIEIVCKQLQKNIHLPKGSTCISFTGKKITANDEMYFVFIVNDLSELILVVITADEFDFINDKYYIDLISDTIPQLIRRQNDRK